MNQLIETRQISNINHHVETGQIKQELDYEELTVKIETNDDEEEDHVYPVRNKMESSCTSSTCPVVEENLLGYEELGQETHGDCHQSLTSVDKSKNTVPLRVPEIKREKQHGPCGHDEEIHSCQLCQLSCLQSDVLDDHVKMLCDKKNCKHKECCNHQQVLLQDMGNKINETTMSNGDFNSVEATIGNKTKSRQAGAGNSVNFIPSENTAANVRETGYKMALSTDFSETDYKKALQNEDCGKKSNKTVSDSERNAQFNVSDLHGNRICAEERACSIDDCGIEFTHKTQLQKNDRTPTELSPFKCDACSLEFTSQSNVWQHARIHIEQKPYKCDVCGVGFGRKGYLQMHKRTHTGEKPYKCDDCGVGFARKVHLQMHKRTHTGDKPYKCDDCGVGFAWENVLQRHKRTHTGEKPYKCDICGVAFAQTGHLHRHKRTHSGEKPYKCDDCGVGFARKGYLQIHKRTHTGEKPYKCDVCGVGLAWTSSLQCHKKTCRREAVQV